MSTTAPNSDENMSAQLRKRLGSFVVDNFFWGISQAARLHPQARPERHDIEVISNVPYRKSGRREHLLDIYRPVGANGPLPVVLYVHGGGFRILSKDTHWLMGLAFARQGYLVVNINYRLAPENPYPAAIADACHAYAWVMEHIERYGGDPQRLVLAGESAGANLVTSMTIAACYDRPEPWAREVYATNKRPDAVLAACGILQVSDARRLSRRRKLPTWLVDRLEEVGEAYLLPSRASHSGTKELADPLLFLEQCVVPERPLPPFFAPVGTRDPLLDDTRRLAAALERLGAHCEARFYPGEIHAFHAFLWRSQARKCWLDSFEFLDDQLFETPTRIHSGSVLIEPPGLGKGKGQDIA